MVFSESIVPLISNAYTVLFKQATVLGSLLDYQPSESCRTPKEMLIECVTLPNYATRALNSMFFPKISVHTWDWDDQFSLDSCKTKWEQAKPDLFSAIQNFPQEKLLEEIQSPWGKLTWRDFIAYCYWNPMWHAGQMAYIQMIHGDERMH